MYFKVFNMKLFQFNKAAVGGFGSVLLSIVLSACSDSSSSGSASTAGAGESVSGAINAAAGAPSGNEGDCAAVTDGVNWDALMTENCRNLSDYNLFQNSEDTTQNPNAGGVLYDLTTPLFTDYASKYRYVFVPEGKTIKYNANEVLEFPVGTVLAKTFTMPVDTSMREGDEYVIETRLMILREGGWIARPYYWNDADATDATLQIASKKVAVTTTHKGNTMSFDYIVPSQASCLACHAVQSADGPKVNLPIGPKSRFLNRDFDFHEGNTAGLTEAVTRNQLEFWAEKGILEGLPAIDQVATTPVYRDGDEAALTNLSTAEINDRAEAYLDINCAHCHRADLTISEIKLADGTSLPDGYRGAAGSTGVQVEYNRDFDADPTKFGVCKTPVAGGHNSYPRDVVPGRADLSYLKFRVETTESRHKMPELGRVTSHSEGVDLITAWIDNMPAASCTP